MIIIDIEIFLFFPFQNHVKLNKAIEVAQLNFNQHFCKKHLVYSFYAYVFVQNPIGKTCCSPLDKW